MTKPKSIVKFKKYKPEVSKSLDVLLKNGWVVWDSCDVAIPDYDGKVRKAIKNLKNGK